MINPDEGMEYGVELRISTLPNTEQLQTLGNLATNSGWAVTDPTAPADSLIEFPSSETLILNTDLEKTSEELWGNKKYGHLGTLLIDGYRRVSPKGIAVFEEQYYTEVIPNSSQICLGGDDQAYEKLIARFNVEQDGKFPFHT